MIVFMVMMLMGNRRGGISGFTEPEAAKTVLLSAIYISAFLLIMAIQQMHHSEKWKASWMYLITPVHTPGAIILGGAKAIIAKFYLPIAVFITVTGFVLFGPKALPNLLLGIINILLIMWHYIKYGAK